MATNKNVKVNNAKKLAAKKVIKAPVAKLTGNEQYVKVVKAAEAIVDSALATERGLVKMPNGNATEALPQGQLSYRGEDGKLQYAEQNFLKDADRREKIITRGGERMAREMLFRQAEPLSVFTRGGLTAAIANSDANLCDDPKVQKFFNAIAVAVKELYPEAAKATPATTRTRGKKAALPVDPKLAKFIE